MRRKRRKAFSIIGWLAVFWLSFSLLAVQAEAAPFPNVERLEQHAAQLERAMKADQWSKPYRLFNQVKRDYEAAKNEVARVRPQTARAQLEKPDRGRRTDDEKRLPPISARSKAG